MISLSSQQLCEIDAVGHFLQMKKLAQTDNLLEVTQPVGHTAGIQLLYSDCKPGPRFSTS